LCYLFYYDIVVLKAKVNQVGPSDHRMRASHCNNLRLLHNNQFSGLEIEAFQVVCTQRVHQILIPGILSSEGIQAIAS
jgi:hypothetical protein